MMATLTCCGKTLETSQNPFSGEAVVDPITLQENVVNMKLLLLKMNRPNDAHGHIRLYKSLQSTETKLQFVQYADRQKSIT